MDALIPMSIQNYQGINNDNNNNDDDNNIIIAEFRKLPFYFAKRKMSFAFFVSSTL